MILMGMSNLYMIMVELKIYMYVNMFVISYTTTDFINTSEKIHTVFFQNMARALIIFK